MLLRFFLFCVICSFSSGKFEQANSGHPLAISGDRCTAIAVGNMATKDGATMTTHTMDCKECDWRINKVPAADHLPGSTRPIYLLSGAYPRQVRDDRGLTWSVDNLEEISPQKEEWLTMKDKVIIGYIPQVEHTYALVEGGYGIMNEHQVAIGESTCASRLYAKPIGQGGKALLEASELSQIALERSKSAREAILIMGALAEEYGFYSGDWGNNPQQEMGEGGEALTVVDKNEVWMFHILPDDTGTGAIWVAQRVPNNHIVACANTFVIREIPDQGEENDDFMMSTNLHEIGARMGWYDPSKGNKLNFLKTFAPERYHPSYSHLRIWRIFTFANPLLNLPIDTNAYADDYPFSVEVSTKHFLSSEDLMNLQSDHFEGTKYDPTRGIASGPYGDPNRYDASTDLPHLSLDEVMAGEYPRAISLFRTTYSFVTVSRNFAPDILSMFWFAPYAPAQSSYTPIFIKSDTLPKPYTSGTMHRYDPSVAWWNHCVVGNWANRFYKYSMRMVDNVRESLYLQLESNVRQLEVEIMTEYAQNTKGQVIPDAQREAFEKKWSDALTELTLSSGEFVTKTWRDLFPVLMATYRDGYIVKDLDKGTVNPTAFFYPKWWLTATGYFDNPGNKDNTDDAIMFSTDPITTSDDNMHSNSSVEMAKLLLTFAFMMIIFTSGYLYGKKSAPNKYHQLVNNEGHSASVNRNDSSISTNNYDNNNNNINEHTSASRNTDGTNDTEINESYEYKSYFLSILGGQTDRSNEHSGRYGYESIEMSS